MPPRKRDGSYRNEKIQGLKEGRAYEFLTNLQQELTNNNFSWRDFTEIGDKSFHPSESNGYLAVIVTIEGLDFNVLFRKTKILSLQLIYTNRTKEKLGSNIIDVLRQGKPYELSKEITIGIMNNNDNYSWMKIKSTRISDVSIQSFLHTLRLMREDLKGLNNGKQP